MSRKPIIGFIGVGYMGGGMAKNIVTKGYELYILGHRKRENVERLVNLGAKEVKTPMEMAEVCDMIHICVSNSPVVENLVLGQDGILKAKNKKGLIIIDTSTSDPVSTLKLADLCSKEGVEFSDAPLSRTPKEAEAGTLDCFVGAKEDVFKTIEPVLSTWSANILYLGPTGNGHKMKLVNNMIALGYGALYAEAIALTRKSGLTVKQFNDVIGSGRLSNGFFQTFMQYVHGGDVNAHKFTLENGYKDMSYVDSLANSLGMNNPMQAAIRNTYAMAKSAGKGEQFVPQIADFVAEINGLGKKS